MTDFYQAGSRPDALPRIMAAPNGARKTKADHPALPVTIAETVACAKACFEAGAQALHFHIRDENQAHILDAGLYREALAELALAVPEMHLQITTETIGIYAAQDMRAVVRAVQPPGVSIGVAEMIPDYQPDRETIRFYQELAETPALLQHICYRPEDVQLLARLLQMAGLAGDDIWCLFVLGHYSGRRSQPELLPAFLEAAQAGGLRPDWAVCAFAREEQACLEAAVQKGGKIRVGFENSLYMPDGSLAADNAARLRTASQLFKS
jgi:uncharacterized protein (DUF849 family)